MLYSLALIAVSVLALVSAKTSDDPSRTWEVFGSETHTKCKDYLENTGQTQVLKKLLEDNKCREDLLQCKDAFVNPSVNLQLFGGSQLSESENVYVVELICFIEAGKWSYVNETTQKAMSSFLTLVADAESEKVLDDKIESIKFFPNIEKMTAYDENFGRFYVRYSGFDRVMSNFGLVLLVSLFGRFLF